MFSVVSLVTTFALFAFSRAAIPADYECGQIGNGFCLACPKRETMQFVVSDVNAPSSCTCSKGGKCLVFKVDGTPSTMEAYDEATRLSDSSSMASSVDDLDEIDDEMTGDINESIDKLREDVKAMKAQVKQACWSAAPDDVDKSGNLTVVGSKCSSGGKTWSMSEADAAKLGQSVDSFTESTEVESSSSSSMTSTTDSMSTTSSAKAAAYVLAPLALLVLSHVER